MGKIKKRLKKFFNRNKEPKGSWDKCKLFQEKLEPLLKETERICNAAGIPFSFFLQVSSHPYQGAREICSSNMLKLPAKRQDQSTDRVGMAHYVSRMPPKYLASFMAGLITFFKVEAAEQAQAAKERKPIEDAMAAVKAKEPSIKAEPPAPEIEDPETPPATVEESSGALTGPPPLLLVPETNEKEESKATDPRLNGC